MERLVRLPGALARGRSVPQWPVVEILWCRDATRSLVSKGQARRWSPRGRTYASLCDDLSRLYADDIADPSRCILDARRARPCAAAAAGGFRAPGAGLASESHNSRACRASDK